MKILKEMIKLTEMSKVGFSGDLEIYVNTNDPGKIPHFHFRNPDNWEEFHGCIRIEKSEYFNHGNKQSKLNSKQRKELVEFLNSPHKRYRGFTYWEILVRLWNENNSDIEIPDDYEMPNYLELR